MVYRGIVALSAALVMAACSSSTAPETTLWEADLSPVLPSTVSGTSAAVSQFGRTLVSIEIGQAEAGVTYTWRIERSGCGASGSTQGGAGLYPALTAGEAGTASADATLPGHLVSSVQYAAKVIRTTGETEQVVACGELSQDISG